MSRQRGVKATFTGYLTQAVFTTISLEAGTFVANQYFGYDLDYAWPLVVGPGYQAFRHLGMKLPDIRLPGITAGRVAPSGVAFTANGHTSFLQSIPWLFGHFGPDPDIRTRAIRYQEARPAGEFFWDVPIRGRSVPVRVFESRLFQFCRVIHDRQNSSNELARLYPTSRNALVPRPFRLPVYTACITILRVCNLLAGLSQGSAGYLSVSPRHAVGVARMAFGDLVALA